MSNVPDKIEELKANLKSNSFILQLQSIDEVIRLCQKTPKFINVFKPEITLLKDNNHPWIKERANECFKAFKTIRNPSQKSSIVITDINDFINFLLSVSKRKHLIKILELYLSLEGEQGTWISDPADQLRFIIENKTPHYLEMIFSNIEIYLITSKLGLSKNLETLYLNLYKKMGIKVSRGDYIDL